MPVLQEQLEKDVRELKRLERNLEALKSAPPTDHPSEDTQHQAIGLLDQVRMIQRRLIRNQAEVQREMQVARTRVAAVSAYSAVQLGDRKTKER